MKISISFVDDEREQVRALVTAVKQIIKITRYHEPKAPKDNFFHLHISTSRH